MSPGARCTPLGMRGAILGNPSFAHPAKVGRASLLEDAETRHEHGRDEDECGEEDEYCVDALTGGSHHDLPRAVLVSVRLCTRGASTRQSATSLRRLFSIEQPFSIAPNTMHG